MSKYFDLNVALVLLKTPSDELAQLVKSPKMLAVLNGRSLFTADKTVAKQKVQHIVDCIKEEITSLESGNYRTNLETNNYLLSLIEGFKVNVIPTSVDLAKQICKLGNKGLEQTLNEGIVKLCNLARATLDSLTDATNEECIVKRLNIIRCIESVLSHVKTFDYVYGGMMAGADSYPPSQLIDLPEPPEPDFESKYDIPVEVTHMETMIDGMGDYIDGTESYSSDYFQTVVKLNDVKLVNIAGNEGKVFDVIKEMGSAAYKSIMESLNAVKGMFSEKNIKEQAERIAESGERNKKALSAMKDKTAEINETAKESLVKLAEDSDPSGDFAKIVTGFKSPTDGERVIDSLLGIVNKIASGNSSVDENFKEAKSALDALKKASDDAVKGDEENADVVAANKAAVNENIKLAKEKLKSAKLEIIAVKKQMSGYEKAISGISPKIFVEAKEEKE